MSEQLQKAELPTILQLRDDKTLNVLGRENDLNVLLNQQPPKDWIAKHPVATGVLYIPIARQEWLMTRIFVKWWVEVKHVELIANNIAVTVRVHYLSPIDGQWLFSDGVGAVPLQTDKGAGATDFDKIKSNAVQMGLPSAKSHAFKDAVESIGNLFGKDLNRRDNLDYDSMLGAIAEPEQPITNEQAEEINNLLKDTESDGSKFVKIFGVESVELIPSSSYERAIGLLNMKLAKQKKNENS